MNDKTQIEKDVAGARAVMDAHRRRCLFSGSGDAAIRLVELENSPAFAAQFDELLKEYAEAKSRADYFESEGGYSPETTPDWDAVNTARARLREFVLGESK